MKQLCRDTKGNIVIEEMPMPSIDQGKVLVRVEYSLISSGTERRSVISTKINYYKSLTNPMKLLNIAKRMGSNRKTSAKSIKDKLRERVPLGYSCVGTVIEKAPDVKDLAIGDVVACVGPEAMHAEIVSMQKNLVIKIDAHVDRKQASFVTIGCIALHAMRNAKVQLGDKVAVIGLGLIGQLVSRFLRLQGAHTIGVDILEEPLGKAKKAGIEKTILIKEKERFSEKIIKETEGHGCDAVIVCTTSGSKELMEEVAKSCRDRARFVVVGIFDVNIPYEIFYRKELEFVISRSTGPGRYDEEFEVKNMRYPVGFIPWTEKRNAEEFIALLSTKKLEISDLISKEFAIEEAKKAYEYLKKEKPCGILLRYLTKKIDMRNNSEE